MRKCRSLYLQSLLQMPWLMVLAFLLASSLGTYGQESPKERKVLTEKQERAYYIDSEGKKKYFPNSKTQQQWNKILEMCPKAISIAEEYNVNIWQNTKYKKKEKTLDMVSSQ